AGYVVQGGRGAVGIDVEVPREDGQPSPTRLGQPGADAMVRVDSGDPPRSEGGRDRRRIPRWTGRGVVGDLVHEQLANAPAEAAVLPELRDPQIASGTRREAHLHPTPAHPADRMAPRPVEGAVVGGSFPRRPPGGPVERG